MTAYELRRHLAHEHDVNLVGLDYGSLTVVHHGEHRAGAAHQHDDGPGSVAWERECVEFWVSRMSAQNPPEPALVDSDGRPCWEITERWPKFCARLANGHGRCRKGTCVVVEARQASLFDQERTDGR